MTLSLDLRVLFIIFCAQSPYAWAEFKQLLFFNFDFLVFVFSPLILCNYWTQSAHLIYDILILSYICTFLLSQRRFLLISWPLHYVVHQIIIIKAIFIKLLWLFFVVRQTSNPILHLLKFLEIINLLFILLNSHCIFFHLLFKVILISIIIINDILRLNCWHFRDLLSFRLFFASFVVCLFQLLLYLDELLEILVLRLLPSYTSLFHHFCVLLFIFLSYRFLLFGWRFLRFLCKLHFLWFRTTFTTVWSLYRKLARRQSCWCVKCRYWLLILIKMRRTHHLLVWWFSLRNTACLTLHDFDRFVRLKSFHRLSFDASDGIKRR